MAEESAQKQEGTREATREGGQSRVKPVFTPSRQLLGDHQRALRERTVTLVILVAGLLIELWTVLAARGEQRVFVIDPVGGTTQGPLEPLATSKGFFSITSINATQAALQRSSVGFDLQEMLSIYFSSRARHSLEEDLNRRMEDVRRRHLTHKPVIDSITPPQVAGPTRVVRISGRLQTTGAVNGRVFYDEPPFEMLLVYRSNPDLSNKAAMPWIADEVELAVGDPEIAHQRARNRIK